ncbi:class I SAM-dependent methyltransferase [Olivibacter sp. SDN3]|uniref:class I SAM-dependent methyltransferase n=1 Tax=Olivibacter sp. SDN3 TaxID=2764720 RepID=UPI0016515C23|nr:class I SAM-dependent methyltransferase [Olivibacter sp. SDN3]QNL48057.1 class I SAM-dependent methyltransferase [Olivibacter sp. SDN3]
MNIKDAYDIWAKQYDTNENRTRDLERISLRTTLANINFERCLEVGCGTGKNTEWLATRAHQVTAIDLSSEMLAKAKQKISADNVLFVQADITKEWNFPHQPFDLITFSLVLEHIENLEEVFEKLNLVTTDSAYVYIGELHPFKQYHGTKARFETEEGLNIVTCFNHNISDFTISAKQNDFDLLEINEYFDENDRTTIPRILTILLRKRKTSL